MQSAVVAALAEDERNRSGAIPELAPAGESYPIDTDGGWH